MSSKRLFLTITVFAMVLVLQACGGADDSSGEDETDGDAYEDAEDTETADGDESIDGDAENDEAEIEAEEEIAAAEPFMFTVISDTHVRLPGNPDDGLYDNQGNIDNLSAAVERINTELSDAAFVALTGDMVGALFSDDVEDYGIGEENPAEKFKELADGLDIPYYAIMGNHDYQKTYDAELDEGINAEDNTVMEAIWKKVLGIDPYYSIMHNGVRMIFLNANRGDARSQVCFGCTVESYCTGSFDDEQLAWFEAELENGDPTILFFHHPPFTDSASALFSMADSFLIQQDDPFYDLAETYQDQILAVFTGHGHIWEKDYMYESIPVFETGSIGDTNGDKDNIHIVEVDPAEMSITVTIGKDGAMYWSESFDK